MRALVTGAGGFVGRFLVERLRRDGHEVFAAGGPHDRTLPPADINDITTLHAIFDLARPEVVFHLAAQASVSQALREPDETYATNVLGTANVLQALREWQESSGTKLRLVFTSSAEIYGPRDAASMPLGETLAPQPANPYAASKAALIGFYRRQALEVGPKGITVNTISPGYVMGERIDAVIEKQAAARGLTVEQARHEVVALSPLERMVRPESVAYLVTMLASPLSQDITGADFNVTAGVWMD